MAGGRKKKAERCCVPEGLPRIPPEVEEGLCRAGGLEAVSRSVPRAKALSDEAMLHSALSDPVRLLILHSLERCDLCPCLLKEITGLADSKLSYHLGVLEDAGLIRSSAVRRWRVYSITDAGMEWLKRAA
ncbi:MAG: winged helix-turn-helix domain-containing protein [Methanomassiliicoccales archaeon]|nr:winged helix-turn-helix domain-containing protein [Methanomassiliicoccales archaeon]